MTAHLLRTNLETDDHILKEAGGMSYAQFTVDHTAIQIERSVSDTGCGQGEEGTRWKQMARCLEKVPSAVASDASEQKISLLESVRLIKVTEIFWKFRQVSWC